MAKPIEKAVVASDEKSKTTKAVRPVEKPKADKPKKTGAIKRWWVETKGELRKVSWPTTPQAIRLTKIVLIVMALMAALLGLLDSIFSWVIGLIVG